MSDSLAGSYKTDPKFVAAVSEGSHLLKEHMYGFAIDSYKKANKIAGGRCSECLQQIFAIQLGTKDFKGADKTALAMGDLDPSPHSKSLGDFRRAEVVVQSAGAKPKPVQMEQAHALLQSAVENFPANPSAYLLDGEVLARLGKMDEAKAAFTRAVQLASTKDPSRLRAEHFAENPELSLHKMAPSFEVTALDGSHFNLDAMSGKVVLIDFWATWCGPCNEALPEIRRIAQEFAGQPLVIISVSWDADESKWKDFIAKNHMTWLQYRDADHKLAEEFEINNIPHYFTIDSDGVLTAEMVGTDADVEGRLKKLLQRAREGQKQVASNVVSVGN